MSEDPDVQRLKDAIEGECNGLAITDEQAIAILSYVMPLPDIAIAETTMSDETTSNAPAVTDEQIDALDDKFVLSWMAPRGRESVRAFARELLALAAPPQSPKVLQALADLHAVAHVSDENYRAVSNAAETIANYRPAPNWMPFALTLAAALDRGEPAAMLMDENSPLRGELRRLIAEQRATGAHHV